MKTRHTCVIGDSRKMMEIEDNSIQLVVTSPPYWQLKDYESKDQIGFKNSYEEYINNLNLVWNECYRVLQPGCRLLVNIGDQFARSVYYGRYKIIPIRTEIIKFCETIGFDYMGAIIWQKKTTMNTSGGATIMGSFPYPRNGIIEIDYEFILILKKPGKNQKVDKSIKEKSRIPKEKWKEYFSGHWYFGGAKQDKHIAMFPVELPKRAIEMFTFVQETVLDPFLGSGTTSLAAMSLNRNSIGYEINKDFLPIIKQKLGIDKISLFQDKSFNVKEQEQIKKNWQDEINKLPYIFKDPIKFDKKIDPNKMNYGSKISVTDSQNGVAREEYFTVKKIISPEILELNNSLKIHLLGIKENKTMNGKAIEFLKLKLKGQKIFLKFDQFKYDNEKNLYCYLYLKNKTFINAHLVKSGFVFVDKQHDYKYKNKFVTLMEQMNVEE